MMHFPLRKFWLVTASAALLASASPSVGQAPAGLRASVGGVVSKEPGGEPVKKAVIELIAESQGDGGNYTAMTGSDGGFLIENILPGRYRLFVERSGYQEIDKYHKKSDGRSLTLNSGQDVKDIVIHLQAAGVVEGRVTDEDGDPMPEAQVAVMRQGFVVGRSHWEQVGAERTNDLGEYRIAGLTAGNYFVSVTPPPDFRSLIEAAGKPSASPHNGSNLDKAAQSAYQTTYYPGTRDRGQATAIQIHAGDDFPVNFSLTPSPSLIIRGTVVNLPRGSTAAIMLQSKDFNLVLNGAEMHKDGSFEIRDVSPGAYTILANVENAAVPMMARQSLQVASANVEGIRLAAQPGGEVHGRLRMEISNSVSGVKADASRFLLMLRSTDGDEDSLAAIAMGEGFSALTHVNADGSFQWKNVPAGSYFVQIAESSAMPDWFLKSVSAGARDAMDSGFSVSGGSTALDVLISSNGGAVEGIATNSNDEVVAAAVVVAVPEARFRAHPDRYRKTISDQRGKFTLNGLPPGEYTLLAWESMDGEAYYDPEFLKSFEEQGKVLRVKESDRFKLQLKAIPAVDDQP